MGVTAGLVLQASSTFLGDTGVMKNKEQPSTAIIHQPDIGAIVDESALMAETLMDPPRGLGG